LAFKTSAERRRKSLEYYHRLKTDNPEGYARRRLLETARRRQRRADDAVYKALTDARSARAVLDVYHRRKSEDPTFMPTMRARHRDRDADLRRTVIGNLGGACACCGETEYGFLSVDHIKGGGNQHRRERGHLRAIYVDVIRSGFDASRYRVLCMNCNWATRSGRLCPHQVAFRQAIGV